MAEHHVPPRCFADPDTFTLIVSVAEHRAYHTLFGIPRTLKAALRILAEKHRLHRKEKLPIKEAKAFRTLFGNTKNLGRLESILRETWWTPRKNSHGRNNFAAAFFCQAGAFHETVRNFSFANLRK